MIDKKCDNNLKGRATIISCDSIKQDKQGNRYIDLKSIKAYNREYGISFVINKK